MGAELGVRTAEWQSGCSGDISEQADTSVLKRPGIQLANCDLSRGDGDGALRTSARRVGS